MKDFLKYIDKPALTALLLLSGLGVMLINSAAHASGQPYWLRQLAFCAVALVAFIIVFNLKTGFVFQFAPHLFVLLLFALGLQLIAGRTIANTRSWMRIGIFSIQFSEFVKIPLLLILAKYLTTLERLTVKAIFRIAILFGVPTALIVLQPDFGVSFILCSPLLIVLCFKRIRPLLAAGLIVTFLASGLVVWNIVLRPYQKNRIISFLNPGKDKASTGYQLIQSKIAIGGGGLFGKGYLKGSQSQLQFLPTRHTDFIAAVLAEEFGFIGISLLFLLFFILFYRQFKFKFRNDEEFYYIYLFNFLILFQFLINIAMAIGLFPVLGVPLPFVSYGGSSLLSFFIGEAIVFRIKINSYLM